MQEIGDLVSLLTSNEQFRNKYGYNPHDNYAWREVMSFNYLEQYYPSIKKLRGRYDQDGICPELKLSWIEHKSVNATLRKKTQSYNFDRLFFEFDVSESRMRNIDKIDGLIFSMYDRQINHPHPITVLFVYGENLKLLMDIIKKEHAKFYADGVRKRETIEIYYPVIAPFAEIYGVCPEPVVNIMDLIL